MAAYDMKSALIDRLPIACDDGKEREDPVVNARSANVGCLAVARACVPAKFAILLRLSCALIVVAELVHNYEEPTTKISPRLYVWLECR